MSGWTDAVCNAILDDNLGTTARTAPTTPLKLALETTAGTGASAGTEAAGYTRPSIAFSAAASKQAANSGALTIPFSSSPGQINAIAIYGSEGTPVRRAWGPLTTPRTPVSGDSIAFAVGAIVVSQGN